MSCSAHNEQTCRILLLTMIICYICVAHTENTSTPTLEDVALAVFKRQNLNRAVIFKSQCTADWRLFRKMLEHIQTSFITTTTLWRLDYTYFRTGVLIDIRDCPIAKEILRKSVLKPYFNSSYRWLIVSEKPLQQMCVLQNSVFRLDTSITVAQPQNDSYVLMDLYKSPTSDAIVEHPVGQYHIDQLPHWVDAENAPFRSMVHRTLSTGLVVLNSSTSVPKEDVMKRFSLIGGHPQVPATYFAMKEFHVYLALCSLYNISIDPHLYAQSGYPNEHGIYSGILGALQTQKVQISAMKLLVDRERMKAGDYYISCDLFERYAWDDQCPRLDRDEPARSDNHCTFLLQSNASFVACWAVPTDNYNAFMTTQHSAGAILLDVFYYVSSSLDTPTALFQPFAPTLWISVAAAVTLSICVLSYAGYWEIRSGSIESDNKSSTTTLLILGTFSGQGHPTSAQWYSSRTVILMSFVMGFLLVSAYNAMVVRFLLNTPAPNIRSRPEFMSSPLKMAVENYYHFYKAVFDEKMDDSTRQLYNEKVVPPKGGGYQSVADGFQGVLAQRWAMFAQVNNIQLEMAKATPGQVCRLAWIHDIYYQRMLCPVLAKRSDLKNLLSRGYLLARERGLHDREKLRHHATQIICMAEHKRQWVPVKIQIVLSAVCIVLVGVVAAVVLLAREHFIANKKGPFKQICVQ